MNRDLEKQVNFLKRQLESETLLRVDLENKNKTLREELQFNQHVYETVCLFFKKSIIVIFPILSFFAGGMRIQSNLECTNLTILKSDIFILFTNIFANLMKQIE